MTDKLMPGDIIRVDEDVPEAHDLLVMLHSRRGHYRLGMLSEDERLLMLAEFTSTEFRRIIGHMQKALELNEPGSPNIPHVVEIKP